MSDVNPDQNKTDQIDYSLIPDQTVTVIIKNKGEVQATGLTLPVIEKGMPEEDLLMAMQRVKDVHTRLNNTIFYKLAGKPDTDTLPELE